MISMEKRSIENHIVALIRKRDNQVLHGGRVVVRDALHRLGEIGHAIRVITSKIYNQAS